MNKEIKITDAIILDITKKDILDCIKKAKQHFFLDNLRPRDIAVSFDCKVRGYIGETGIKKLLEEHNIRYETQTITKQFCADIDITIIYEKNKFLGEIKTSNKPKCWNEDNETVLFADCIKKGDIKIIRKNENINSIDRDIYIQIYFNTITSERDKFLENLSCKYPDILTFPDEELYNLFEFSKYIENTLFLAWIDKKTLINNLSLISRNDRFYLTGGKKEFWVCKIKNSFSPSSLIPYITKERYIGIKTYSKGTKTLHKNNQKCAYLNVSFSNSKNTITFFDTPEEAEQNGYKLCLSCFGNKK